MKFKIKEVNQETLITQIQKNFKNNEKYLLISTKDMLDQTKMNLETFCPNIESNRNIDCYIEKVPKEYEHPFILINLEKKLVTSEQLENFVEIPKQFLPIIPIKNTLEFNNVAEIGWFLKKIAGHKPPIQDHIVHENHTEDFVETRDNIALGTTYYEPEIEIRPGLKKLLETSIKLFSRNKIKEAIYVQNIATILDKSFFTLYNSAFLYFLTNDLKKCKEILEQSLELNPEFSQTLKVLGMCHFQENQFEKALEYYEKIDTKKFPNREVMDVELHKGRTKMMLGLESEAIGHFGIAEKLADENEVKILHKLVANWTAHSAYAKQDWEKVIEINKILLSDDPENIDLLNNVGMSYLEMNKPKEAKELFLKAYKLDQNHPIIIANLVVVYHEENEINLAKEKLDELKKLGEKSSIKIDVPIDSIIEDLQQRIDNGYHVEQREEITSFLRQRLGKTINSNLEKVDSEYEKMPKISVQELREKYDQLKEIIAEFVRKRYSSNIKVFQKDFQTTYFKISKIAEDANNSGIVKKETKDLFDHIDFGDFPYIMQTKRDWKIPKDILNSLFNAKDYRNTIAHFGGPEKGELDKIDSFAAFSDSMRLIRYFENKKLT